MISEVAFARQYTSFWQQALPMSTAFVRSLNRRPEAFDGDEVIAWQVRWDVLGDLCVRLLGHRISRGRLRRKELTGRQVAEIAEEAVAFIRRQRGGGGRLPGPRRAEIETARTLAERLARFLAEFEPGRIILPHPPFDGCGVIDACRGDLLVGETLYEVKINDKGFRAPDLRQLVIYAALNHARSRYQIKNIGVVNPRLGIFFRSDLRGTLELMAGTDAYDLLSEILDFVSTERVSV